jgi:uncharacterized membrane protein YebE (DUF533 family)
MSLMKTLARVAIGVAVAKGAKSMMRKRRPGDSSGSGSDLGGLLGGLMKGGGGGALGGNARPDTRGGGIEGMLGGLLGGRGSSGGGGLGGMLERLGGSRRGGGGLGGMLGGLAGAAGAGGMLAGGDQRLRRFPAEPRASFGEVLNSQFDGAPEQEIEPSQDQEALAALMLAAMIQAAMSDGTFDAGERAKLLDHLGELDAEDEAFVEARLKAPVDVDALVRQTPLDMGPQVYAVSLLAIDLDTQAEAQYLDKLAKGYGLSPDEINEIHGEMGMPTLYT